MLASVDLVPAWKDAISRDKPAWFARSAEPDITELDLIARGNVLDKLDGLPGVCAANYQRQIARLESLAHIRITVWSD